VDGPGREIDKAVPGLSYKEGKLIKSRTTDWVPYEKNKTKTSDATAVQRTKARAG